MIMVLNVLTFIFPQRLVFQIKAYNKDIHLIVPCELLQLNQVSCYEKVYRYAVLVLGSQIDLLAERNSPKRSVRRNVWHSH